MNIYDMLINRALNGGSGGGGGGGDSGDGDAFTATVTFAVQGSDWMGVTFNASYALRDKVSDETVNFSTESSLAALSTDPTVKLPLLKNALNLWTLRTVEFYAPDGETQLQGNLHFTGDINPSQMIYGVYGDCTITLVVGGQ